MKETEIVVILWLSFIFFAILYIGTHPGGPYD